MFTSTVLLPCSFGGGGRRAGLPQASCRGHLRLALRDYQKIVQGIGQGIGPDIGLVRYSHAYVVAKAARPARPDAPPNAGPAASADRTADTLTARTPTEALVAPQRQAEAPHTRPRVSPGPEPAMPRPAPAPRRAIYWPVAAKFWLALLLASAWFAVSLWLAEAWLADLAALTGWGFAIFAIGGVALIPGFMNTFLVVSLLLDRRPRRRTPPAWPGVSVIVAAYNEEAVIAHTLHALRHQDYPGAM